MNFQEFLESKKACEIAQKWAIGKTIEQAIDECHRGDWLLWLAKELNVEKRLIVGTAGHCANTVRDLMKDERSRNCVDVCIRYGNGEATDEELAKAAAAAAAADAAWAWAAAEYAAAAWAAAAAEYAAWAAAAAEYAAWAADAAAAWAAAADAAKNQKQTADICRKHLKEAMIEKWNK